MPQLKRTYKDSCNDKMMKHTKEGSAVWRREGPDYVYRGMSEPHKEYRRISFADYKEWLHARMKKRKKSLDSIQK